MSLLKPAAKKINKCAKRLIQTVSISLFAGLVHAETAFPIDVMMESFPPYSYLEDGKRKGVSVETLHHIVEAAGYQLENNKIHVVPWSRGFYISKTTPETMLFNTSRIPERESYYQWVGPIDKVYIGALALKERNIKINTIADINNYKLGVVRDSAPKELLIKAGVDYEQADKTSYHEQNIKKLLNGRVDIIFYSVAANDFTLKNMGLDPEKIDVVYKINEAKLYYAFHKDTDKALIERLNKALQAFKQTGNNQLSAFEHLRESYIGKRRYYIGSQL